ncbi:MAG: sodium:proton antiporter [bacterium]
MLQHMFNAPLSTIVMIGGFLLILVGLWGMLSRQNIIKMIIGFSLIDTGIHMVMVAVGYLRGKTAPIIETGMDRVNAVNLVVDPIPSALVLTAIVIGLGVTALMLSFAIQIYQKKKTLSIDDCTELKW